jgi:enoyl-CoA hydratase/carnithine racemase
MGDAAAVIYEQSGPVVVVTMNRPDQGNSINDQMRSDLFEAWDRFGNDDSAAVAVLTGAGSRFFCTGADLKEMAAKGEHAPPPGRSPIFGDTVHLAKPVIAAVNGMALAGGFLMAESADLCIASETAAFGVTEARRGRGAPWATQLTWGIPKRLMLEILMVGEPLPAERAAQVGLVNRVVSAQDLMTEALALANTIARNAPLSVRAAKQMMDFMPRAAGLDAARQFSERLWADVYASEDALEGPRAFREGRPPVWKGR